MKERKQAPVRRKRRNGTEYWEARYRDRDGKQQRAKPEWNGYSAAFPIGQKKRAQRAIDEALAAEDERFGLRKTNDSVAGFAEVWQVHGRRKTTRDSYKTKVRTAAKIVIEGRPFGDWTMSDVGRKQMNALIDALWKNHAPKGIRGILAALSALWEDAIESGVVDHNPAKGIRVKQDDERKQKPGREPQYVEYADLIRLTKCATSEARLAQWKAEAEARERGEEVKPFSAPERDFEAELRVLVDGGMRLGEMLGLHRPHWNGLGFKLHGTASYGKFLPGSTRQKNHERTVPATPAVRELMRGRVERIGTDILFPNGAGNIWSEQTFKRDVWYPAVRAAGLEGVTPHDLRHSFVTREVKRGKLTIDQLADITGDNPQTLWLHYYKKLNKENYDLGDLLADEGEGG